MQAYDIIMLLVLVAATVFGAWKGLAWQVASLAAIFASYYVALQFRDPVAAQINADPPWNVFVAMALLYVGTSFAIWLAFRFVRGFIDALKLKSFDAQIGALFGFAKGVVLCVIITLFAVTLLGDDLRKTIVDSRSGYYIAVLLDKSNAVMPKEVSEVLAPYIHTLDERLNEPRFGQSLDPETIWEPGGNVNLVPIKDLLNARGINTDDVEDAWRR
jgi:membrane protein required for colicin V production